MTFGKRIRFALCGALAWLSIPAAAADYDPGTAGPIRYNDAILGMSHAYCTAGPMWSRASRHPACRISGLPRSLTGPARAEAHLERGIEAFRLRYYDDADREFSSAMAADPASWLARFTSARFALAMANMRASGERLDEADRLLKTVEPLRPDDPDVQSTRAYVLWMRSRREDAIDLYDQVLSRHHDHLFAREQRAMLNGYRGMAKAALADFDILLSVQPQNLQWRYQRSVHQIAVGNFDEAADDLDSYIASYRFDREAYILRAHARINTGDADGALEDLNMVIDGSADGMTFVIDGEQLAALLLKRAFVHLFKGYHDMAVADALKATSAGGRHQILRLQVYLRKFDLDVEIDGEVSEALQKALRDCFGLDACAERIFHRI